MNQLLILVSLFLTFCQAMDSGAQSATSRMSPQPRLSPISVDQLTKQLGCDETFVARDPDSTIVLSVQIPGLLKRSRDVELPYSEELIIGKDSLFIQLESGTDLHHWCTDLMERPPQVVAVWKAVSGEATVVVERQAPHVPEGRHRPTVPISALVRLKQVVLAREDSEVREVMTLPNYEIAATLGVPGGG